MGALDGKVALVTGAGRGFGRAIALAFRREGADVAVNYRASGAAADEVTKELRGTCRRAFTVRGDVARAADGERLGTTALQAFGGGLDVLVNNAGIMTR